MNRKRNVCFNKPEDPEFLKVLKKQAGYDDRNHKFDELENADDDFQKDEDSEKPQVVVISKGDLTAEEADIEQKKIELKESQTKADLNQRVIFKSKKVNNTPETNKRKIKNPSKIGNEKKSRQLLSFGDEDDAESDN